ncbi:6-phosphogluconolactonase [Sphingomonas sabuli]|uniref:6-phosphogluconolactonase n=1 Tax=Sphingomonas sabuli TaxID=2764186 RepID=A0A7G9KZA4_9SPHN|nr:6-phosphogluconolactonase [Sphingomonas sabuli]QNM81703.1 6-phosphogluconolactonase [Sphingomonas sabuli]
MTDPQLRLHPDKSAFTAAIAGDVAAIIAAAIDARGQSLVAFPGGSTPRPVFERLCDTPLPWDKVTILPTDERIVEPGHMLSNAAALSTSLAPVGATIVPLVTRVAGDADAGNEADIRVQSLAWPLDLVWLGMGTDGHTASIFAGPDLANALDAPDGRHIVAVRPGELPAEAPVSRVTLTARSIRAAQSILLSITGVRKRELIEAALADGADSPLPIGQVLAGATNPVTIHWCPE